MTLVAAIDATISTAANHRARSPAARSLTSAL
jgi:hypothetical protein